MKRKRGAISTGSVIAGATMLLGVVGWVFGIITDVQKTQASQGAQIAGDHATIGDVDARLTRIESKLDSLGERLISASKTK